MSMTVLVTEKMAPGTLHAQLSSVYIMHAQHTSRKSGNAVSVIKSRIMHLGCKILLPKLAHLYWDNIIIIMLSAHAHKDCS